ncbi:MAG: Ig-like domain-containing protein, partial [Oscillospiraceae bacterium]|nr:Ig-like domain-containing protein [Oscillospiraceae bacterium]
TRRMEKLNRGLVAVYTTADTRGQTINGVVLSWRLLGDEDLTNQAFDIYRNGTKIHTTGVHDATYYRDTAGTATSTYKVVKAGASAGEVAAEPAVTPTTTFAYAKPSEVGSGASHPHSFTWVDIPISMPTDIGKSGTSAKSDYKRTNGAGGANDASVGDLDGDGDYEIILKWDPIDSKDSTKNGVTGHCVIDAYEIDPNNDGYMWRIDLGNNVTAGAHYTQYIVYDFDGDGKSEVAMTTAPGSYSIDVNGEKHYVTEVGDTDEIRNADNNKDNLANGKNIGPEYYTIFSGETGRPLKTTAAIPLGATDGKEWGKNLRNESHRYLAGVAYLDGVNPYYIACRGYYYRAVIRAYSWDGENFTMLWEHYGDTDNASTMYGQGNHNLSIADIDNDGKDEIVWGSACLDDDGQTVLGNTRSGHGDAMHVSDFNNDGVQEIFSVKEKSQGKPRGADFRVAKTGTAIWSKAVSDDNGRGVMDNIDDAYAATHPDGLALGWSAAHDDTYDIKGNAVAAKPSSAGKGDFCNFLVYWDGDLGRELLDANIIQKYDAENGWTKRFFGPSDGYTLSGETNNDTKRNYCLVADLWGDWREEIIMAVGDSDPSTAALRIFTSIVPTDYRLTTLMHDCQYREAIAWQNVGYNQPPHTSYYIGSAALATDDSGNKLNYLAPATPYTRVVYPSTEKIAVEGLDIKEDNIVIDKGSSVTLNTVITPENATTKGINWESDNPAVATVSNGVVKGVSKGTAKITATSKDTTNGTISDTCTVTVNSIPVTGLNISGYNNITVTEGGSKKIEANVIPADATDKLIHWTSSNENVVTVDSGTVKGIGIGSAIITAVTNEGGYKKDVVVTVTAAASEGVGSSLYDKGNATANGLAWSGDDASDWKLDGTGAATPELIATDTATVFGYHPAKPGTSYSAEKTFDTADGALVTYDADWYFGSQTGANRDHIEYLQFGSNLMLGWQKNYCLYLSTDGGTTWSEAPIFTGSNTTFIKNVHVVMDTAAHTIKTVKFDGNVILSDHKLPDSDKMNTVKFGLIRNGASENWEYPNGLANLTVLQYIEGAEQPEIPTEQPTDDPTEPPVIEPEGIEVEEGSFKVSDTGAAEAIVTNNEKEDVTVSIISAVYDDNGVLTGVKFVPVTIKAGETETIRTGELADPVGTIRAFLWDMRGYVPIKDGITPESETAKD